MTRREKISRGLVAAVGAAIVGGVASCTVGPDYGPPVVASPTTWALTPNDGLAADPIASPSWWTAFHDAELNALIERAVQSNRDLRVSEARLRQARAIRGLDISDFWPTLDTTGSAAQQKQSQNQPLIGSLPLPANFPFEYNVYNAGFDAAWEIDLFGGKRRALEASAAELGAAVDARNDVLVSVQAEVARNYIELRGGQRRLAIAQQDLKSLGDGLALTRARFQGGVASELDVTRAAAQLAGVQAELPPLETDIRAAIYRIALLLGQRPDAMVAELSPAQALPPAPPAIPLGLPSELLRRRPDVRQAERQLAAETARIGVAEAAWFPKLSLTGDVGVESVHTSNWFQPQSLFWSIGPSLQWRALDFGRVRAEVASQTAVQEAALATYEKTVLTSLQEVESALVAYAQEQNRHAALAQQAEQSLRSLAMAKDLYTHGQVSFLDVLVAQHTLTQADDQVAVSDQAIAIDGIAVYKALGGGWETPGDPSPAQLP